MLIHPFGIVSRSEGTVLTSGEYVNSDGYPSQCRSTSMTPMRHLLLDGTNACM